MRYFIHLAFDGSEYSGWQRQAVTQSTVQEVLENKIGQVVKQKVTVNGCGRTDAGVHSSQFVAHIEVENPLMEDFVFRTNNNLPDDIVVYDAIEVSLDQHCRFHALSRTYDYFIHWKKDLMLRRYSAYYPDIQLDINKMREAASLILKTKEFKALCKQPDLYNHTLCEISNCEFFIDEKKGRVRFSITSNRFLRGMIRYCVGYLIQIGTGKLSLADFNKILTDDQAAFQKKPAPANGLFLSEIAYPFISFEETNQLMKMMKIGLQ